MVIPRVSIRTKGQAETDASEVRHQFCPRPELSPLRPCTAQSLLNRGAYTVCPLDRAWLIQLGFTFVLSVLGGLFSGEGLALLVDLRPFTNQAYWSRVTNAAIGAFACSDSGHGQLVQFVIGLVLCTTHPLKHA